MSTTSNVANQPQGQRVSISDSRASVAKAATDTATANFAATMMATSARAMGGGGARLAQPFVSGQAVMSAAITKMGTKMGGAEAARAASATMVAMGGTGMRKKSPATQVDELADAGDHSAILMQETRAIQEMNQAFNLQFLQLQHSMESENRQFTTLSNVMKTKHETAKKAIENIK